MKWNRARLHVLALLATLACTSIAEAEPNWIIGQRSDGPRYTQLSFGAALDGYYGFGFTPGVLLGIPIVDGGFIPPINDSLYLEPGLHVSTHFGHRRRHRLDDDRDDIYVWVIPEIGPRWNFHLTPNWDVFATIKAGWAIGSEGGFWIRGTAGMNWFFARPWSLRIETASGRHHGPGAFIGLTFEFS
jgi:hypothetical protein